VELSVFFLNKCTQISFQYLYVHNSDALVSQLFKRGMSLVVTLLRYIVNDTGSTSFQIRKKHDILTSFTINTPSYMLSIYNVA